MLISTDYVFDGISGAPYEPDDRIRPLSIMIVRPLRGTYAALPYRAPLNNFRARSAYALVSRWSFRTSTFSGSEPHPPSLDSKS